jgi:diadenosine tetraphosphate (Ap4A) HIT family hydrolase
MKIFITLFFLSFSQAIFATPCAFCNKDVIENQVVFEGDFLRVLVDYAPRVKGHLLIILKRHVVKAHEVSAKEWEELARIIPRVVRIFERVLNTNQYIILEKNGPRAYQSVPHVHFHILPIQSQSWNEIFNIEPHILSEEDLQNEINDFRNYFAEDLASFS